MTDPPYGNEITFTASIKPTQGTFPGFHFGYYDISDIVGQYYYEPIISTNCIFPCPSTMTVSASFYIPANAGEFTLYYSSSGDGTGVTNIALNFQIANYDPCRAGLLGGDDINPDTDYCDEQTQPGKPRARKYRNKGGAGPGK